MLIQRLRDGSNGIMAKVIIGLIIVVFGLFGFGSITTFLAPVAKVATVNGEDVTQRSMEIAVERNRRLLMARGATVNDIDEDELRENVLRGLITREVLTQAAAEFELYYSDAELDADIVSTEVFQLGGVFSADQFQNVVRSAGYTTLGYRDEMRTDKLFEQMLSGIRSSSFVTDAETKRYSSLLSQTRDLAYLQISAAALIDEITVTSDEILDYYTDNSAEFVTDETVNLQYVELKHEDLAAGLDIDPEALAQYFVDNLSIYSAEGSRRLAHILIEASAEVSMAEAKTAADEIYSKIKEGEDFTVLAQELSNDSGSKGDGGDLGFNPQGTFFPEFETVAYDLALNQVSPPVETEIGYHIIKVLDIQEAVEPDLDEVRTEVELAYRLAATDEDFVTFSARLAELLFESIDLETPAADIGLDVKSTGHLSRNATHALMANNKVRTAAFSADVLIDGNNSDLIEITDNHHVGVRVLEHRPSASKPLEEVEEDIRYILQRGRARVLAEERAVAIVQAIEGGSLAQYVANEYNLNWEIKRGASRYMREVAPQILREAFTLPRPALNKESLGYSILQNGDSVVLRVSAVTNKPEEELPEIELASIKSNLPGQLGAVDFQDFENSLTAEASLERTK